MNTGIVGRFLAATACLGALASWESQSFGQDWRPVKLDVGPPAVMAVLPHAAVSPPEGVTQPVLTPSPTVYYAGPAITLPRDPSPLAGVVCCENPSAWLAVSAPAGTRIVSRAPSAEVRPLTATEIRALRVDGSSSPPSPPLDKTQNLLERAEETFGHMNADGKRDLAPVDRILFEKVAAGQLANYCVGDGAQDNPKNAGNWGPERIIPANRIVWLCTDPSAMQQVTNSGIFVRGARIDGDLDLNLAKTAFVLRLEECVCGGLIGLLGAEFRGLDLCGSQVGGILAGGAKFQTVVWLHGVNGSPFRSASAVMLNGATISGDLDCHDAEFNSSGAVPTGLSTDGLHVGGDLLLMGTTINGVTSMLGAKVDGKFDCRGAKLNNPGAVSLHAVDARFGSSVYLSGESFASHGRLQLLESKIGGNLECTSGTFEGTGIRRETQHSAPDPSEGSALFLQNVNVGGSILLRSAKLNHGMVFSGVTVDGDVDCQDARVDNPGQIAMAMEGIRVKGRLFLKGAFRCQGGITLKTATVDMDLDCRSATLCNSGLTSLDGRGMHVGGSLILTDSFNSDGEVQLIGATVDGDVDCKDGAFSNPVGDALTMDNIAVNARVFLNGAFQSHGGVRLLSAKIGGNVECSSGKFDHPSGVALAMDLADIGGAVFLNKTFKSVGTVRLHTTMVRGDVDCSGGSFTCADRIVQCGDQNNAGVALGLDHSEIKGALLLMDGFASSGVVRLAGAHIGKYVECRHAQLHNPGDSALILDRATIGGNVSFYEGVKCDGQVDLIGAAIGGTLRCYGAEFNNRDDDALVAKNMTVSQNLEFQCQTRFQGQVNLQWATVKGALKMHDFHPEETTIFDLRWATVHSLADRSDSWPKNGKLHLDGFVYEQIGPDSPSDTESRINWLHLQPLVDAHNKRTEFPLQPYNQLAEYYRKIGREGDGHAVLVQKELDHPGDSWWSWPLKRLYYITVGYGYYPWLSAIWAVGFIVFGGFVFRAGWRDKAIIPSESDRPKNDPVVAPAPEVENAERQAPQERGAGDSEPRRHEAGAIVAKQQDVPRFYAWVYSLEVFTPFVKFHQEDQWAPRAGAGKEFAFGKHKVSSGTILQWYQWAHMIFGHVLAIAVAAGLAGLLKTK